MSVLNTQKMCICNYCSSQPSWILIFSNMNSLTEKKNDAVFELTWPDEPVEDSEDNKRTGPIFSAIFRPF